MINLRDDKELAELFKTESEERLHAIEQGLTRLEVDPSDPATIEALFRDVHTLKGSAGMVGANDIQAISHRMEDLLGAIRRGQRSVTADLLDKLHRGLYVVGKLVDEAVTGAPSGVDVWQVMTELREDRPSTPSDVPARAPGSASAGVEPSAAPPAAPPAMPPVEPASPRPPEPPAAAPAAVSDTRASGTAVSGTAVSGTDISAGEARAAGDPRRGPAGRMPEQAPEPMPDAGRVDAPSGGDDDVSRSEGPAGGSSTAGSSGRESSTAEPESSTAEVEQDAGGLLAPMRKLQIDTIRVPAIRLDMLMMHAGELAVTRTRLARRLTEIEELIQLWEEQTRDVVVRRGMLKGLRGASAHGGSGSGAVGLERVITLQDTAEGQMERLGERLRQIRNGIAEESARIEFLAAEIEEGVRAARLLPVSTIFNLFPRMVRELAREERKEIFLIVEGGEITVDKRVIEELKDPLMHMLRNAVDHGVEMPEERVRAGKPAAGTIRLRASKSSYGTVIEVSDDGRGLDPDALGRTAVARGLHSREEIGRMSSSQIQALVFAPGFSTRTMVTDLSGRGVGMDVVRASVEKLKGTISIDSVPGTGATFRIALPATLATARVILVSVGGHLYALPIEFIHSTVRVGSDEIHLVEGRETIVFDDRPISVAPLADLLELGGAPDRSGTSEPTKMPCVVIADGDMMIGLLVDDLVDELEVVLKPGSGILRRVRNVSGSTILGSGKVCVILNPHDLARSARSRVAPRPVIAGGEERRVRTVLLVEDSITTRTQMKRILEGAGYQVATAVDGVDGFGRLATGTFDAVISDVQMPNMDGLKLTATIRADARYAGLPVILVTSLAREEDKRRGIEVGANAYLTKPTFDQKVLIDTLRRLI